MGRGVVVRLYAAAREAAGTDRLEVPISSPRGTLGAVLDRLIAEYPALAPLLPHCRFARNGTYVRGRAAAVRPGDEIAVHPPYSGG